MKDKLEGAEWIDLAVPVEPKSPLDLTPLEVERLRRKLARQETQDSGWGQ